jgi:hypothetical protein
MISSVVLDRHSHRNHDVDKGPGGHEKAEEQRFREVLARTDEQLDILLEEDDDGNDNTRVEEQTVGNDHIQRDLGEVVGIEAHDHARLRGACVCCCANQM